MTAFKKVNPVGRKTKLSREIIKDICQSLMAGAYIETAVVMAKVSKVTFYAWIKKAHKNIEEGKKKGLHIELLYAVEEAQEQSQMRDLLNIDKCAMGQDPEYMTYPEGTENREGYDISGLVMHDDRGKPILKKHKLKPDWSASAWRLQRKHPAQWGLKETVDHTSSDGSLNINFTKSKNKDKK